MMRGRLSMMELTLLLSVGRAGVSRWSGWLGLWLACVIVLPVFAQRPDIVWMRGGQAGGIRSVAFSPDGSLLALGNRDSTIKLWRVSDGKLVRTLEGHTGWVLSVSFSPDGRLLASGSFDGTIKLWRVSGGTLLQTYDQETWRVLSIQFSPDGRLFGYGRDDATVVVARNPFAKLMGVGIYLALIFVVVVLGVVLGAVAVQKRLSRTTAM